jgi:ATP-dependent Zn protease
LLSCDQLLQVSFADVAGCDEAKRESMEFVDSLEYFVHVMF